MFRNFGDPAFNSHGHTAFAAILSGNGVDDANNTGIWSETPGALSLVARAGDQAPGLPDGVTFGAFHYTLSNLLHPVMNSAGQTAFGAVLAGSGVDETNNLSIWTERDGSLELVARAGEQAPGAPEGVVFSILDTPAINAAGQVAFRGFVSGAGINPNNDVGIWAEDHSGELQLIARHGDVLEIAPGDFRTIGAVSFIGASGNDDGRASAFNDLGQLAFGATFANGTGAFISNAAAIPEPPTLALTLVFWLVCARSEVKKDKKSNNIFLPRGLRFVNLQSCRIPCAQSTTA